MAAERLCDLEELTDPGSRGFSVTAPDGRLDGFVVRQADRVFAYRNSCPHTGAPLDWTPNGFLDLHAEHIQCAFHGALFSIETGACIYGPCGGRGLDVLSVEIRDGAVYLLDQPIPWRDLLE